MENVKHSYELSDCKIVHRIQIHVPLIIKDNCELKLKH
jgi:hypothetical protein